MSNIREVSRLAGVSTATVSRALSQPEKVSSDALAKVRAAVEEAQYRPNLLARNFRSVRNYSLIVLVPDITNPFFTTVIQGIEDTAQRKGYSVLLGDTRDSAKREEDYIKRVETRQSDGIIQMRPHYAGAPPPPAHLRIVNAGGCEGTPYECVRIDNEGAAKAIVDHLIALGHRRIGVISGPRDNPHAVSRLRGYRRSLAEAGIAYDSALVAEGSFSPRSGLDAAAHFIGMRGAGRPTAVFSINDEMAIGALQGFKKAGLRIPEDISITGFDDSEFSRFCDPPLSTVAQPGYAMGCAAAETLIRMIEGERAGEMDIVLPYELIIRQSTAPPA